jgi:hypothetical protein
MAKAKKITKKKFKAATGREPVQDELERCNCNLAGQLGHWGCGWCETCNKPNFVCPCMQSRMEAQRLVSVPLTYESDLPRPPLSNIVTVNITVGPVRLGSDAPRGGNSTGAPPRPLDATELEIARADMKFLIEKEKESGDWDKWLKSQRTWDGRDGR